MIFTNPQPSQAARWFIVMIALVPHWALAANAQNPVAEAQVLQREANQAYQAGDYVSFTRSLELALELNPASLTTRFNLARGYALTGQSDKALELLRGLVRTRVDFDMAHNADFELLRELPAFEELVAELAANLEPVINSSEYFRVEQLGLIPEGIAFHAQTRRFFFSSMRTGDVYVLDANAQLSKFASVGRRDGHAAIGMTVDPERGVLWVVGTSFFMAENFTADAPVRTGVFGFDLTTGALAHEYLLDDVGMGLNDVAIGPSGELYASGQILHVLNPDTQQLEPLATTPELFGSNGITTDPSGKTLFISSYPVGLAAIDIASGTLRFLETQDDVSLYGIDGLYWYEGDLVGIQNGVEPWRLLRMTLDEDFKSVTRVRVIEFANDAAIPTTGAIVGNEIYYIGQEASPEKIPSQYPELLAPYVGNTIIRRAPLDR